MTESEAKAVSAPRASAIPSKTASRGLMRLRQAQDWALEVPRFARRLTGASLLEPTEQEASNRIPTSREPHPSSESNSPSAA